MIKIFGSHDKVNFVDSNNIMLGYDLSQQCCEQADYMIYKPEGYEEDGDVFNPVIYDDIDNLPEMIDKTIIYKIEGETSGYDTNYVFLCTIKGMVIMLINTHNGYYSHGFELKNDNTNKVLEDGSI